MISVIVTVGPDPAYKKYLNVCLISILAQSVFPLEIVLVDDAAHLDAEEYGTYSYLTLVKNEWNFGQACSLNRGIALSAYDLVFVMGGSDDRLLSGCIEACYEAYQKTKSKNTFYFPIIETSEGETSNLPQGVWMFHKDLWRKLGGYPREASIGEVDSIFCSVALKQGVIMQPCGDSPLYWHREHSRSLTYTKSYARHDAAEIIRGMCTQEWEDPSYWTEGYSHDEK